MIECNQGKWKQENGAHWGEIQIVNPIVNLGSTLLALPMEINNFISFIRFHMIFNNSSLLMSNLIWIKINFMDMKRHVFIWFFISMLVGGGNELGNYKYENNY